MQGGKHVGDFLEQAPYLEWQNSSFKPGAPCATCHLPAQDEAMMAISSPIAKFPQGLSPRKPYGKHEFKGGNAYMLRLMADNIGWTGSDVAPEELSDAAARAEAHLGEGAIVSIVSATPAGSALEVVVQVENHTGHKLPTGYPGRRAWLHLRAEGAGGETLFESGAFDGSGALVDTTGARIDTAAKVLPHRETISSASEVQVYEAVAVDAAGKPTHLALESTAFAKDNRLLPVGWSDANAWIDVIAPVGVSGDPSFGAGMDRVTYRIDGGAQKIKHLTVELLYQSIRPAELEALRKVPHAAAVRFSDMASGRPPTPVVMAQAALDR
jgi:hypothetical protein